MAIYQPTNIVPSSFAGVGGGVVDAGESIRVSWQVNGNSPMTKFVITVCANTAEAAVVHTETVTPSEPFYGTDARGNPVPYVYEPGAAWTSWGLSNGNSYKYRITQYWGADAYVEMNTEAVFVTRAAPSVSITPPPDDTVTSIGYTFMGTYSQSDGDAVNWVRWTLEEDGGGVIEDTGEVYTQVLSFPYDRFFNGRTYTLTCIVETENGVQTTNSVIFDVTYSEPSNIGEIDASCNADDSVTLTWGAGVNAPGTADEDYGTVSGGLLNLNEGKSVTWDTVNGEPFSYDPPYLFAWRAVIGSVGFGSAGYTVPEQTFRRPNKTYPGRTSRTITDISPAEMVWNNQEDQPGSVTAQIVVTTRKTIVSETDQDTEGFQVIPRGYDSDGSYLWLITWKTYVCPVSVVFTGDDYIVGYTVNFHRHTDETGTPYWTVSVYARRRYWASLFLFKLKATYEYYVGTATATPPEDGVKNVSLEFVSPELRANGNPFAPTVKSTVSFDGTDFTVNGVAAESGTYDVSVQYDHTYVGPLAYKGVYRANLYEPGDPPPSIIGGGEILSGYTLNCTPGVTAYLQADGNNTYKENYYTVTFYGATNSIPSTDAVLVLNAPQIGDDSYVFENIVTLPDYAISGITHISATRNDTLTPEPVTGGVTYEQTGERSYRITVKNEEPGDFTVTYRFRTMFQTAPTGEAELNNTRSLWSVGSITAARGEALDTSVNRLRTDYLPDDTVSVTPSNGYSVLIYVWDTEYKGVWTGSGFTKNTADLVWFSSEVSIADIGTGYRYKLVAKNSGGTAMSVSEADNITLDITSFEIGLEQAASASPLEAVYTSGGTEAGRITLPRSAFSVVLAARLKSDGMVTYEAYPFDYFGAYLGKMTAAGTAADLPASVFSVTLTGEQTADYVYFATDADTSLESGTPVWDGNVRIYARFTDGLGGGTTDEDDLISFSIYRTEADKISLVGNFPLTATRARDYGIRSGVPFSYTGYYVSAGAYSQGAESREMCKTFRQFTLIEAEPDANEAGVYHAVKVFRFRNNIDGGTYANNNSPVFLDNFTRYPLRQPTAKNALSGVLSGLLGYFENGEYKNDSVSLADAVSALSTTANPLFLRDLKGHILMVGTSGPISRSINNQTRVLPTTISIPWTEVGDASDVSIISIE